MIDYLEQTALLDSLVATNIARWGIDLLDQAEQGVNLNTLHEESLRIRLANDSHVVLHNTSLTSTQQRRVLEYLLGLLDLDVVPIEPLNVLIERAPSVGDVDFYIPWQQVIGFDNRVTYLLNDFFGNLDLSAEYVYPAGTPPITVSLNNGPFGRYVSGTAIPVATKTMLAVLRDIAAENVYPTYTVATISLTSAAAAVGEVGESVTIPLNAIFAANDAGALTTLRILRGSTVLVSGSTTPQSTSLVRVRSLTPDVFTATADYAAGAPKAVSPSGNPDERTPQIRSTTAPQASEVNFTSNSFAIQGYYKLFYGPGTGTSSAAIRALAAALSTGTVFVLNTGTVLSTFLIVLPLGKSLLQVIDLDNASTNITSAYVNQGIITVNDAGGTPRSYTLYQYTAAGPYTVNTRHQFTTS